MSDHSSPTESAVMKFDCEQSVRRLWDYLDDEFGAIEIAAVDAHLVECDRCPPHCTFERRFLNAVRAARDTIATTDAPRTHALRVRVVDMLRSAGEVSMPGASS